LQIRRIRSALFLLPALTAVDDGGQLIFPGFGQYWDLDSPADRGSLPRSSLQKFCSRISRRGPFRWHLQVQCNMLGRLVRRIADRCLYLERLSANHGLLARRQLNGQIAGYAWLSPGFRVPLWGVDQTSWYAAPIPAIRNKSYLASPPEALSSPRTAIASVFRPSGLRIPAGNEKI